jgi:hypothetical protein
MAGKKKKHIPTRLQATKKQRTIILLNSVLKPVWF